MSEIIPNIAFGNSSSNPLVSLEHLSLLSHIHVKTFSVVRTLSHPPDLPLFLCQSPARHTMFVHSACCCSKESMYQRELRGVVFFSLLLGLISPDRKISSMCLDVTTVNRRHFVYIFRLTGYVGSKVMVKGISPLDFYILGLESPLTLMYPCCSPNMSRSEFKFIKTTIATNLGITVRLFSCYIFLPLGERSFPPTSSLERSLSSFSSRSERTILSCVLCLDKSCSLCS